jgi:glycine betaine/proline transport system substrate-binding protein
MTRMIYRGTSDRRTSFRSGTSLRAGLLAVILAAVTACSGQTASFSGGGGKQGGGTDSKSVSIAVVAGWDEDVAASYLWQQLLQQRGYKVSLQELDVASTFTGVANGQLNLYMDAWLPVTQAVYWKRFQNQLEKVTDWQPGRLVLAVPNYVNVSTVADLKANAGELGHRIVGIEAGAGEMRTVRDQVIPGYGLGDFNLVEGSTPAMLASLDTAIKRKQSIVVTLWQPHWAFSRFPIKILQDPKDAFGKPDQLAVIATKGWSAKNPEVAGWLKNFKISPEQLADLMLKIKQGGKGKEQAVVKQWIAANQKVVDAWFAGTAS